MGINMGVKITKKKKVGKGVATVQHKNGGIVHKELEFDTGEQLITEKTAEVHVEMGNTINTGNYESSKFSVGLTMPCDVDDIEETYELSQNWVNDRLALLNEELQESLNG